MALLQVWEKTSREKLWQTGKYTVHWKYFHHRGGAKDLQLCLPQGHPMTNVPLITSCFKNTSAKGTESGELINQQKDQSFFLC